MIPWTRGLLTARMIGPLEALRGPGPGYSWGKILLCAKRFNPNNG